MELSGWFLGFLWIGSLFTMGFAYLLVHYLPIIITFFAFIGTMLFLMVYIIIKMVMEKVFCENSERNTKILAVSTLILNVIKIFISIGSYLLLIGYTIWLGLKFEPSGTILPIAAVIFIQLILVIILKLGKRLNDVYFTVFLLVEPYLFLYVLLGDYYSRGLLFQGI
ncbi:MAG: hypothetical protein LBI91_06335 [Spirochaetaceae bacterium]|nr:hypothetical protein [Spirochaetaceae bacterium]